MSVQVLPLLEKVLGPGVPKSKGNYAFHCPFCHHSKAKMEIHPETHNWHCWVCGSKGKSLVTLFKRTGAHQAYIQELYQYVPKERRHLEEAEETVQTSCKLPSEFKPLWIPNEKNFDWKTCTTYLASRGVTRADILKYRLGYCTEGRYKNMIIFPNYDKFGQLNYFTTRSYLRNSSNKFINPPYSRNVVGFELQLNWDLPVILVESALDAIVVKRNASPLYGTDLPKALRMQIIENEVTDLYIALDSDALKKAIRHAQYFMGFGVDVYFVQLPTGADPNSLGHTYMWELIKSAKPLTGSDVFKYRLQEML